MTARSARPAPARCPVAVADLPEKDVRRFWSKVGPESDGCRSWHGRLDINGYGTFGIRALGRSLTLRAHRVIYELMVGAIPDGLVLDHLCHNDSGCPGGASCPHRRCVNPAHLEPVTTRENLLRGVGFVAQHARATVCANGHPYDNTNTYRNRWGGRHCRPCRAEVERRRRQRVAQGRPVRTVHPTAGEKNANAKLSEANALEIRERSDRGEMRASLAREFHVSEFAIFQIAKRRSWKHLP